MLEYVSVWSRHEWNSQLHLEIGYCVMRAWDDLVGTGGFSAVGTRWAMGGMGVGRPMERPFDVSLVCHFRH